MPSAAEVAAKSPSLGSGESPRRMRSALGVASDLAAIVLPVVGFWLAPGYDSNLLFLANLMIYVMLAQGVNLTYGFTGYLPFGYVGFYGAGAYGASLAMLNLHVPPILAILIGAATAVVVAVLVSPLLRLSGAYFAIASLAAALALGDVIANPSLTSITQGPYGLDLSSVYNSTLSYRVAVVAVGVTMAVVVFLKRSRFGLALRAVRDEPISAAMSGVHIWRERTLAWLISAALGGGGGALFAWTTSVFYPSAVFDPSISVFAIVFALFGGVGSVWGPLIGTVVLYGLYQQIGASQPQYVQLIYGLLIVALVLFLPGGLAGIAKKVGRR